jgi:hypothetical protein
MDTKPDRETTIDFSDDDPSAQIYTTSRKVINRLRKNPSAKLIESGENGGSPYARFVIDSSLIIFKAGCKRDSSATDREQRQARIRNGRQGVPAWF